MLSTALNGIILIVFGAVFIFIGVALIYSAKVERERKKSFVETDAVVTRIEESMSTDADGFVKHDYTFFVTFQTQEGLPAEAKLTGGKAPDRRDGDGGWDHDLHRGKTVRIRYQPQDTTNAIRIDS